MLTCPVLPTREGVLTHGKRFWIELLQIHKNTLPISYDGGSVLYNLDTVFMEFTD